MSLAAAELGLGRSSWPAGLRWGAAAATLVGAAYVLVDLTGPVREALPDGGGGLGRVALWRVLVVIPLGTVVPEELAFRGLLLALLGRRHGVLGGILLSSGLFGLWHVVPSLGGALLCWLRLRSGSLLAPILTHWTVNGLGVIVTLVA
jgi:uncharacterized protein